MSKPALRTRLQFSHTKVSRAHGQENSRTSKYYMEKNSKAVARAQARTFDERTPWQPLWKEIQCPWDSIPIIPQNSMTSPRFKTEEHSKAFHGF